jgi:hypothetical protein
VITEYEEEEEEEEGETEEEEEEEEGEELGDCAGEGLLKSERDELDECGIDPFLSAEKWAPPKKEPEEVVVGVPGGEGWEERREE